jgi:hypothetical protein
MICRYGSASQRATHLKEDLGEDKEPEEVMIDVVRCMTLKGPDVCGDQ